MGTEMDDGTYVEGGLHPFWVIFLHSVKRVDRMNEVGGLRHQKNAVPTTT